MLPPKTFGNSKTFFKESGKLVSMRLRKPSAVPEACIMCNMNLNIDFNNEVRSYGSDSSSELEVVDSTIKILIQSLVKLMTLS